MQTYIGKLITAREYCIKYHFRAPVIECNLFIRKNISWQNKNLRIQRPQLEDLTNGG